MPSFIEFNDSTGVMNAAGRLTTVGTELHDAVTTRKGSIDTGEQKAISRADQYSTTFWDNSYHADSGRARRLIDNAVEAGNFALDMGPAVLNAVSTLLWEDAVNGDAMYRAANPE